MTATMWSAGAPTGKYMKWNSIDWKEVNIFVKRLQMRISKVVKEKKFEKVKLLLTKSYYAKLFAVLFKTVYIIVRYIKIVGKQIHSTHNIRVIFGNADTLNV